MAEDHADQGWDNYAERVLRNEGRLEGLERLVKETRESDRKLVEHRSESLAQELERRADALLELVTARADAVLLLSQTERASDNREHREAFAALKESGEKASVLLREIYDTKIDENYKQSRESIHALEQRREAATDELEQMVRQWRDSDREALQLFAGELKEHLARLNHAHEIQQEFQSKAVTRELWQAEKEAQAAREAVMRDSIIALDRNLLAMTPIQASDKAHAEILIRMETTVSASARILDNKIDVISEKVNELKSYRDTQTGRSGGYSSLYGWGVAAISAAVGVITIVIVIANLLTGHP